MGSWAQAKLSCGQRVVWVRCGAWNQAESTGTIWEGSGHSLGRTGTLPPLGGSPVVGGCPLQEDFLLVSTMDSEVMRSLSLEVSKQGLA